MNRFFFPRLVVLFITVAILPLACSKGSSSPTAPENPRDVSTIQLRLGISEVQDDILSVPVEYSEAEDLYAISFRIGFDITGLQPDSVEWNETLMEDNGTFQMLDRVGFMPLAFARFDGGTGIDGSGELCRLKFRILDPEKSNPWIISDPDFLVARNSRGDRMKISTGGESR